LFGAVLGGAEGSGAGSAGSVGTAASGGGAGAAALESVSTVIVTARPDAHYFDGDALACALARQEYSKTMGRLTVALDTERNPNAVNWCLTHGYRRGHACVLYMLARNLLKFVDGRVPAKEDIAFGMKTATLLLMRVAQDVRCCRDDMAKSGLEYVYTVIRNKIAVWVGSQNASCLPTMTKIASEVETWCKTIAGSSMPQPTWVTAFSTSLIGATFTWGDPASHDVVSFQRCRSVTDTRTAVATAFVAFLRSVETKATPSEAWAALLSADLEQVSTSSSAVGADTATS
jgi:hypothetical protein